MSDRVYSTPPGSDAGGAVILFFPLVGEEMPGGRAVVDGLVLYAGDEWLCANIERLWAAWENAYPGMDLALHVRQAHAWELSSGFDRPGRSRLQFLNRWLLRAWQGVKRDQGEEPSYLRPFTVVEDGKERVSLPEYLARKGVRDWKELQGG